MKVIFSERAYASIMAETTEKIKTETGGLFLGAIDHGRWYVVEAIDPGPKSVFEVTYFEYDQAYTQHLINKIANLYNYPLALIGLWHRHPGSFERFSSTDDGTNSKYAKMRAEGAISALVNIDPTFRITMYHVEQPCKYSIVDYEVGNHLIPDKLLEYKTPERFEKLMENIVHNRSLGSSYRNVKNKKNLYDFIKKIYPYLKKYKGEITLDNEMGEETIERILEEIYDDLLYMKEECGVSMCITQKDACICIYDEGNQEKSLKVYFKYLLNEDAIIVSFGKNCCTYTKNTFKRAYEKSKRNEIYTENRTYEQSTLLGNVIKNY